MIALGILCAALSGVANGLFTTPMKVIRGWKWENIWLVFILVACLAAPAAAVWSGVGWPGGVLSASPAGARAAALGFGFAWGFGAILFGLSVDRLGVSLANSMVLGISSAAGSLVPLILGGGFRLSLRVALLLLGVAVFIAGVCLCAAAGREREADRPAPFRSIAGYLFATGAGAMSAVFNVGYSLARPIADAGERLGYSNFESTNVIWLLMLAAGSIPNIAYCSLLLRRHSAAKLYFTPAASGAWGLSALMGILWAGSIFLYGAATPLLGPIGPSIGWPLSLAMALFVANLMGILLGEWKSAPAGAAWKMRAGVLAMLPAIALCALSAQAGGQ